VSDVIRALVADDEDLAREGIRVLLRNEKDIHLIGETANGPDTVEAIRSLTPDLVFLDVQMPGFNGFEVLERAGDVHVPLVIFVTAYDRYAVKAFETHAVDYLLKPLSVARFQATLKRVREKAADDSTLEREKRGLVDVLNSRGTFRNEFDDSQSDREKYLQRFVVKDRNRFLLLRADAIEWIESAANYIELHTKGRSHLVRMTMAEVENRLDPAQFTRIHRSIIVKIDEVSEIFPESHGDFTAVLHGGTRLRMGRAFRARLLP
jgi:two-component system LytT family response regulator